MIAVEAEQLAALAALLKERVGLHIRPDSFSSLRLAVAARLDKLGPCAHDAAAYLALLRGLPASFPVGIAVVQHIADGFTEGLAAWLSQECQLKVREAVDGDALQGGQVLLAPSGRHLLIGEGRVRLFDGPPVDTFKPSVTPLFLSAATAYAGRACGVILTGMGHDGATGLKALHDAGGATLAQDEQSSAVFGMAKAAIDLGAVDRVLPLEDIPRALVALTR